MLLLDFGSPEQVSEAAGTVHRGNISGLTPLHLAVWGRHPNSVVLLLQHGADLSARAQRQRIPDIVPCHSGTTPLMLAAVRGAVDIARLILLSYYERVVEPMQRNIVEGAPPPAVVEEDPRCHVNENGNQAWELANQLGFRSFAAMLMPRFELSRLFANRDASHSRLCGPKSLCYIATMVHNKKLEAELLCIVEANKNLVGPSCIKPSLKPPPRLSPVEEQPSWPSVLPPTSTRSTPMRVDQAILPGSPLVDRDSLAAVQRRLEDVEDGTQGILMGLERMESALRSISVLTSAVEREPWRGEAQPERSRGSGLVVPPALTIDFIQRLSNDRNSVASSLGHHDLPVSRRDKRASRLGKLSAASTPDVSTHNGGHSHDVQKEELEVTDAWEECGVCFETLPPVRLEPCRHEVCVECALQLVKKGGEDAKACMTTCPFCRAIVKAFASEAVI